MKYCLALLFISQAYANERTTPPLQASTVGQVEGFTVPGTCSYVYDDPHVFTYDKLANDCQGEGDYVMSKALNGDFEIQARFHHAAHHIRAAIKKKKGWWLGSTNQALVIKTGHPDEPVIEIDGFGVDSNKNWNAEHCAFNYYADGQKLDLDGGADHVISNKDGVGTVEFQRRNGWRYNPWTNDKKGSKSHERNFFFKESGVFVQLTKRHDPRFGCYLNHRICVPDDIVAQDLVGVLGNGNGDPNDLGEFKTVFGTTPEVCDNFYEKPGCAPTKKWHRSKYCQENFCVPNTGSSLFRNPDIKESCEGDISNALEIAVEQASEEIKEACHNDVPCIEDTIVSGDLVVGLRTLFDGLEVDKEIDVNTPADPEDAFETDVCTTDEGQVVPCDTVPVDMTCESLTYDFGFKMQGCDATKSGPFQALELSDQSPTCQVGNYNVGGFDIDCHGSMAAVITPTVEGVVKVKGATASTMYSNLKAGQPHTLTTGSGDDFQIIEEIEFCFRCPSVVVDSQIIRCAADVKQCEDGTEVQRDPENNCQFTCPVKDDLMTTSAPPGTRGDPHFKTHGGEMFDFHGGCDIVLVDNPTYKNGLGLTIHIRTKIETWWSYVESAAIKIGEETLEITGQDQKEWIWLNGAANEELVNGQFVKSKLAGNLVRYQENYETGKSHRHEAHIHLGNGEKILFKTFEGFLKVEFIGESEKTLGGSMGILGTYPEGKRVGRDGESIIEDVNVYGQEWQVTAEEPKLFHSYDAAWVVPAGQQCAMPSQSTKKQALRRRRLAEGMPTKAAEKACAHLSGDDFKACVYDVLATQDTNMAGAW